MASIFVANWEVKPAPTIFSTPENWCKMAIVVSTEMSNLKIRRTSGKDETLKNITAFFLLTMTIATMGQSKAKTEKL